MEEIISGRYALQSGGGKIQQGNRPQSGGASI